MEQASPKEEISYTPGVEKAVWKNKKPVENYPPEPKRGQKYKDYGVGFTQEEVTHGLKKNRTIV